ncbi:MAG: class I SAM-dependent methyltransferase [Anaerolineae bacterium]|nr:class I SAM-dependent methyltransferase [Anaerolineae bacterium]
MIKNLLKQNMVLEEIEAGIFTSIESTKREHEYDNKADLYDILIGSQLYNRIMWGNRLSDYQEFCRKALISGSKGYVLDAGCGSLVFTGELYAQYKERPLVLLDRSLGMLRKAKARLIALNGEIPENIYLLQGDILSLPFRDGVFETVQSFGMLHLFSDTAGFIQTLFRMKSESGTLFFNSLVGNNWLGRNYLKLLLQAGEVATINTSASLKKEVSEMGLDVATETIGNMAYFSQN